MKLFLTSAANQVIGKIVTRLSKKPGEYRLAFVPTAGDPYGPVKPWMDADRAMLVELGFDVEDFDLKDKTEEETRRALAKFDIIFVAGGNTFYLLDHAWKSGFLKVAREMVEKGTIYIGSSAGSYLACPTIEAAGWEDADKNIVGLKDLTALGLVNFLIHAHHEPKYEKVVADAKKTTNYPVITLTDRQFIAIEDDNYRIIDC